VVALTEALGDPGVQYKTAGYTWVGRVTSNVDVSLTWHTKVKTIQEAMTTTAVMAGIGPAGSSGSTLYPMVLNNIVGTKFKLISGYAGANDALIAMERGETDGAYTSWNTVKTSKQDWLDGKKINIIVQYSIDRHPDLPDVPAMIELARTPEDKQVLALYASGAVIGRSVLATPKIPADRVKALRAAFDAMLKDAQFLNEIEKTKAEFDPMSGEQLQKVIEDVANLSPAVLERAKIARGL
jgi:tripartite-type tricarboxylate transporter receptor subunit TctC